MNKQIIAVYKKDPFYPRFTRPPGRIPYVIKSNHPEYGVGVRLDYGFLEVALEDGYEVTIKQEPSL